MYSEQITESLIPFSHMFSPFKDDATRNMELFKKENRLQYVIMNDGGTNDFINWLIACVYPKQNDVTYLMPVMDPKAVLQSCFPTAFRHTKSSISCQRHMN